jgi:hypothetical protein
VFDQPIAVTGTLELNSTAVFGLTAVAAIMVASAVASMSLKLVMTKE